MKAAIHKCLFHLMPQFTPKLFTGFLYKRCFGRELNWKNPQTLNEKIAWLKLNTYRNNALVTQCADKYLVREYVEKVGCGEILNELYGVWERPEDIPWDELPEGFALKCNHGCGYNLICRKKAQLNIPETEKKLRAWLDEDFWRFYAELQYQPIPRRIVAERLLGSAGELVDYKIYCFGGEARYVLTCVGRQTDVKPKFYFFDRDWKFCPITKDGLAEPAGFTLPRPKNLDAMIDYAERLSKPFPFVRVDLYDVDDKIWFGELTFTPSGGLDQDRLPQTDLLFGGMVNLKRA